MTAIDRLGVARAEVAARDCVAAERLRDFRESVSGGRAAVAARVRALRVHSLLAAFADSQREVVRAKIEEAISAALRAVFGPRYSFRLDVRMLRGAVHMEPQVGYRRGGSVRYAGIDSVGGGVADVVSFAFRVAILARLRPRLRRVLVADEPFKHVSESHLPRVARMVRGLSVSTGIQLLIVSHEPEIAAAAHRVYDVSMGPDGASVAVPRQHAGDVPGDAAEDDGLLP